MAKKRLSKITTSEEIGLEMRRVYRQVRRDEIDMNYAKGLIHILNTIVSVIRDTDFEKRLEALEEQI